MRKITEQARIAFNYNENFSNGNTQVKVTSEATIMLLHGNEIAKRTANGLFITNCGWQTNVTKERLNSLNGVSIQQKNGEWYLNGNLWNGELTKVN